MISFEAVSKRYGDDSYAVENFNLEVGEGELCVLVGPSGGGKTTILRMVNRMVEPTNTRRQPYIWLSLPLIGRTTTKPSA